MGVVRKPNCPVVSDCRDTFDVAVGSHFIDTHSLRDAAMSAVPTMSDEQLQIASETVSRETATETARIVFVQVLV